MQEDYYQNILYPLQDKILELVGKLPVGFYLTGGTALSRAYLNHRFSDDLDFFVNNVPDFKLQVNMIIKALSAAHLATEVSVADEGFARILVHEANHVLKLDFVNDIPFRKGEPIATSLFPKTDNLSNILSNKLTALGRHAAKDVVDLVFICRTLRFCWEDIIADASEKDLWVNPVGLADTLENFPIGKLNEIIWVKNPPSPEWFKSNLKQLIAEILEGAENSLIEGISDPG